MTDSEMAEMAEVIFAIVKIAGSCGHCDFASSSSSDYSHYYTFSGLTASTARNGNIRLRAHNLDVVLEKAGTFVANDNAPAALSRLPYRILFRRGAPSSLHGWYRHLNGMSGFFTDLPADHLCTA